MVRDVVLVSKNCIFYLTIRLWTCNFYINNSCHLAQKYARIFVRGHYLFQEANSFLRAKLEENCKLRGTDNVQGQISEHIFAPNGGYCLYYPSNLFRNARSFENWGIFSDILQFQLGNVGSRDALRPVVHEEKNLMDYKRCYYSTNCNTIQIWSWCSRYLSSVGNVYPAIYVASYVGRKSEVKKCRQKDFKMLRVLSSICWIIKQLSCSISGKIF